MAEKKINKYSRRCAICGNIVVGNAGEQYQMVESRGETRYYCKKCLKSMKESKN